MVDLAILRGGGVGRGDPSIQLEAKGHDLRITRLPLRGGPHAGAAVAVRERDAADLGEARHPPGQIWDDADRREEPRSSPTCSERQKLWAAFLGDPEWLATVAETEKDGPLWHDISSQLLEPAAFSSVK
jgi:hypothetical protein